jgi:hypothetical protein
MTAGSAMCVPSTSSIRSIAVGSYCVDPMATVIWSGFGSIVVSMWRVS